MTDKLKAAIITIAEYHKGWSNVQMPITDVLTYTDTDGVPRTCRLSYVPYTTSADAILEVWRKVRDEYLVHLTEQGSRVAEALAGIEYQEKLRRMESIGFVILNKKYPAACELLAEIINELKKKV